MSAARKGSLLLTLAQVWHAASGYVIFITGARILGQADFGRFALVIWTMTTLEIFVVAGIPKAVSYFVARAPGDVAGIGRAGLKLTTWLAVAMAAAYVLAGPWILDRWNDPSLEVSLRISALDFIAFVGFAVFTQIANGLHRYGLQARVWMVYSTLKVAGAVGFMATGFGIEGGVLGYVLASLVGSLVATLAGARTLRGGRADAETTRRLGAFGLPVAAQAFGLMALVNVDLWAAKGVTDDDTYGLYAAAGTLARAIYFVFIAFGDALFPAVARAWSSAGRDEARSVIRDGVGLLLLVLLPTTGLAVGAAEPVVAAVYDGYAGGGRFLVPLALASAGWTLVAVLAAMMSAVARPWRTALLLGAVLSLTAWFVHRAAAIDGAEGAARASVASALIGVAVLTTLLLRTVGAAWPLLETVAGLGAGVGLWAALQAWSAPGVLVFVQGALMLGLVMVVLWKLGLLQPPKKRGQKTEGTSGPGES